MPPITGLQTHNDARHLGRALESLRPCDEILILDRGSTDHTLRVAREYGATISNSDPNLSMLSAPRARSPRMDLLSLAHRDADRVFGSLIVRMEALRTPAISRTFPPRP